MAEENQKKHKSTKYTKEDFDEFMADWTQGWTKEHKAKWGKSPHWAMRPEDLIYSPEDAYELWRTLGLGQYYLPESFDPEEYERKLFEKQELEKHSDDPEWIERYMRNKKLEELSKKEGQKNMGDFIELEEINADSISPISDADEIIEEEENHIDSNAPINIDEILAGGRKTIEDHQREAVIDLIKDESLKSNNDLVAIVELKELAKENNIEEYFVDKVLEHLRSTGEIYSPRDGYIKMV